MLLILSLYISKLSQFFFTQGILIIGSRVDLEILSSLSSILGLHKISLFFVHAISASNSSNKDNNNGESNWNDDNIWVFLFFKSNYFWTSRVNYYCSCLLSVCINIFSLRKLSFFCGKFSFFFCKICLSFGQGSLITSLSNSFFKLSNLFFKLLNLLFKSNGFCVSNSVLFNNNIDVGIEFVCISNI